MRALFSKDLRILLRSPLMVALLVGYPLLIAVLLGFALSRGPDKPTVAILNNLPQDGRERLDIGGSAVDPRDYAEELFKAVEPVFVTTRAEAIEKVRSGEALAAIIIPRDLLERVQKMVALGSGIRPEVEVIYNSGDPVKRTFVESTINSRVADLNRAVAVKLTGVAAGYINLLLKGGKFSLLGRSFEIVGLERSKRLVDRALDELPPESPRRADLERVSRFARLAIDNLHLSGPILQVVGEPIAVKRRSVAGSDAPLEAYAIAAAVALSVLLIGVLLGAGMVALEREENALPRLLRGLASAGAIVTEKVLLAATAAALATLLLCFGLSLFMPLSIGRSPLWVLALIGSGLGCAALGVTLGSVAREVRGASLLAILLALPLAFMALVPEGAVSGVLYGAIGWISAIFPFRPSLEAIDGAINGTDGMLLALGHSVLLALAWGLIARFAIRRTA